MPHRAVPAVPAAFAAPAVPAASPGAGRVRTPRGDLGVRRSVHLLTVTAATLIAAGALLRAMWLIGIGAWVLISAFLIEMIYRP
ncbi:hypothetical protein CRI70_11580 [Streptomyces sp. Ru87]|nr:hypothetical protein CRI70_11580 [Streptomyces sp. Ru87]